MNKEFAFLTINSGVKSIDDLLKKYDNAVERCSKFSYSLIEDRLIANYFKFCVDGDIAVDDYLEMFKVSEPKEQFISRAQEVLTEAKSKYFAELERNIDLKVHFEFNEYTPKTIKNIYDFVLRLQEKENKSLDIKFFIPENGLKKPDLQNLLDLGDVLDQDLIFMDPYDEGKFADVPLSKVIKAYGTMNDLVDKINSLNLSPFEKFLLAHDYAASRVYTPEENNVFIDNSEKSRSLVNVMTQDTIVCVGYAQIVKELCKRLGLECEYIAGAPLNELFDEQGFSTNAMGHAANIVHIVDEKYGIDGYYFCDACWDSKKDNEQTNRDYFYAALPIQDIDEIEQAKYFSDVVKNMNIPQSSVSISIDTFRRALNTVYSNHQQVESDLQGTVMTGYNSCSFKSKNCFMQEYKRQREERALQ